jgi:L-asparaginase / beta-aspartyl-peptidase
MMSKHFALAIHGGAGNISREFIDESKEKIYLQALNEALNIGKEMLQAGKCALDAVESTVVYLENNPLFNAGKGSVLTADGHFETDAAIMDGSRLNAGAIAGVKTIKNPIRLARMVMEHSEHILLTGSGAEDFAKEFNLETVPQEYFHTEERWQQYLKLKAAKEQKSTTIAGGEKFGTVGAVALDTNGNLAAATSTGGMMMKKYGRVGDSPIIGAGTYADNRYAAVSCTGHGEYFMKTLAAYEVIALMKYKNMSLENACAEVVHQTLENIGGKGGLIAVDSKGNVSMPFNTPGMFRGFALADKVAAQIF